MEISATCSDCQILILNVKPAASPGIGKTIELLVSLGNLSTPTGSTKIDWGDNTNETVPYLPIKKTHNYTGDVITPKTISVVVYNNQSKPIARGTILSWEK
jgi:hypothetical protein